VYPGASYAGFDGAEEQYRLTCADLGLMADWYRSVMEQGDWRLAFTEGPEDAFNRLLHFVRPGEVALPPAARTAWAEVVLERPWPYHYVLRLRRDPGGILPAFRPTTFQPTR
jgi:hypothetical protein